MADQRDLWPVGRFRRAVRQDQGLRHPTFPFPLPNDLHVRRQSVPSNPVPDHQSQRLQGAAVDPGGGRKDETRRRHG